MTTFSDTMTGSGTTFTVGNTVTQTISEIVVAQEVSATDETKLET